MKRTIGEIAEIIMGQSPKSEFYNNNGEGMPFLQGNRTFGDLYPTFDTYTTNPTKTAKAGDIIMSVRAPVGDLNITPVDMCLGRGVCALRMKNGNQSYLFYLLKHNVKTLINRESGTVFGSVNYKDIASLVVDYEENEEEQQRIGQFLWDIDQKIETNKAINNNLEQQAKEYFKSLFIDFAAYNGEFVDSPIGLIPATMEIDQISNIPHTLETGKRPKGGAVENGVPSIGAENVKQLGVVDFSAAKFIPEEFALSMKRGRIYGYEVLLYKDGGKPGTFIPHFSMFGEGFPYEICFINEHVFKLDFGHRGYNEFCYLYLQTDYPFHWLANNGGKAAVPGINQQDVNDIWIPTIHNESVKEFCEWVQPIFTTILSNCSENVKLATIRDSLLSRLLSGEIDVSEVEF